MKTYIAQVSRSYTHIGWIEVKAKDETEAYTKALKEINNVELDVDEIVDGTDEVINIREEETK